MKILTVDFNKITGKIKPMHAVGQPPFLSPHHTDHFKYLTEANIPYSRLHDVGGPYGGNKYVDIPNIFRDFDADETDPASYDFVFTDWLIAELMKAKCPPIFRLGVTIENFCAMRSYRLDPPKDPAKWARICEHIIRHYNEGWADGFHYGIEYWEIWNEPENHPDPEQNPMWRGTKEQLFELYAVPAKHLKIPLRLADTAVAVFTQCLANRPLNGQRLAAEDSLLWTFLKNFCSISPKKMRLWNFTVGTCTAHPLLRHVWRISWMKPLQNTAMVMWKRS